MDLSVIVTQTAPHARVAACLSALENAATNLDYEVLLVSSQSNPNPGKIPEEFESPRFQRIDCGANESGAHAGNLGALHATGKTLVFVRQALLFDSDWLQPLLSTLSKADSAGLAGSAHRQAGSGQTLATGFTITPGGLAEGSSAGPSRRRALRRVDLLDSPCVAISRALFLEAGGFDEAYLRGSELFDLCLRLRDRGKRCYLVEKSSVRSPEPPLENANDAETARDQRYLQRRWARTLLEIAAQNWPRDYLLRLVRGRAPFQPKRALEALARWSGIVTASSPSALRLAKGRFQGHEIRWAKLIEDKMPAAVRKELCQKHGNWLSERISYSGFFHAQGERSGVWIKENAAIELPRGLAAATLGLSGVIHAADESESQGRLGLRITINDTEPQTFFPLKQGSYSVEIDSPAILPEEPCRIEIHLLGTARANALAYLGRKLEHLSLVPKKWRLHLQDYRPQKLNQRLCLQGVALDGEPLLDFAARPSSPQCFEFVRNNSDLGINLVGWHTAELGVGESARVAAKALQASQIAHALVPLKATCLASKGDSTLSHLLQDDNPYPINVFHIDAPQSKDIDPSHGKAFRHGKYNIAYWAWELPEFPDGWIGNFQYFDEIWTPSHFVRNAIAAKSPLPVVSIPHCIDFPIPQGDFRASLHLPSDKYLFCFAYDLNSYQTRKNPQAVIEAYRLAFLDGDRRDDVGLVIKTQSRERNPSEYAKLLAAIQAVPNCYLIDETLPRETVYGLMNACDCYVSLHRSEGFGLTVAESMFLGKPVVSTNWSATSEFLDAENGCPVAYELVELKETHGPYAKGQFWADPLPEDAAQKMRRLVNDSAYAAAIGKKAAQTIRDRFSPERVAGYYEARLKAMCAW